MSVTRRVRVGQVSFYDGFSENGNPDLVEMIDEVIRGGKCYLARLYILGKMV